MTEYEAWLKKKAKHDYEYQDVHAFMEICEWFYTPYVLIPCGLVIVASIVLPILVANGII
jgi:hypothetical protein